MALSKGENAKSIARIWVVLMSEREKWSSMIAAPMTARETRKTPTNLHAFRHLPSLPSRFPPPKILIIPLCNEMIPDWAEAWLVESSLSSCSASCGTVSCVWQLEQVIPWSCKSRQNLFGGDSGMILKPGQCVPDRIMWQRVGPSTVAAMRSDAGRADARNSITSFVCDMYSISQSLLNISVEPSQKPHHHRCGFSCKHS